MALLCAAFSAHAEDAPAQDSTKATAHRIGPRIWNAEADTRDQDDAAFASQGAWLADHGIRPQIALTEIYLTNPSAGAQTGKDTALTLFSAGAAFDLQRLFGWRGGTFHFEELFVPFTHNLSYGTQVGDLLAGKPGPYIPKVSHLTLFTLEQKLGERLTVEAGKSNAGSYFAQPLCNVALSCVNAILQDNAGFNPPPYANWGARASYDFSHALRAQLGAWRSNNAYPFTNGWERSTGDSGGSLSSVYLADLAYRTDFTMEAYPQTWEVLLFHNNRTQENPYYTTTGSSQLVDSEGIARSDKGLDGYYLGGRKTFWRADGGTATTLPPTAMSGFASFTHNIGEDIGNGVASQASAGMILAAPWARRPFDSYSLNLSWAQLTRSEQRLLQDAYTASGGVGEYRSPREEFSLGVDANFVLARGLVFSGAVAHVWNANNWLSPYVATQPRDGYSVQLVLHLQVDQWLGLNPR